MVASDAVSNTQFPEEFDASVTIIPKTLLIGGRGSLAPFTDGLEVNLVSDGDCLVWLKALKELGNITGDVHVLERHLQVRKYYDSLNRHPHLRRGYCLCD